MSQQVSRDGLTADVIANIYEAAIDDACWPQLAQIVASAAGTSGTVVWIVDSGQILDFSATDDLLPTQGPYLAHYGNLDPWQKSLFTRGCDQVRLGAEAVPERELVKTEFYNDFARPNGIVRPMGALMRLGGGTFATVAANRPSNKKIFDEHDKPRLQRLVPHLRRALQLRLVQRTRPASTQIHAATLDLLAFGVIICDQGSRIVLANVTAEQMASAGAGIMLGNRNKGLSALVPAETRALAALVHNAASGGAGGTMRVSGRSGRPELLALVTPLPPSLEPKGGAPQTHALVTLRQATDAPSFTGDMLKALFGLSPVQGEIALAIFNGRSPEQISDDRQVALSTVRTHLAEIFARTGATNQRELIRLLGMLPPVRAPNGRMQ
jgi:DNA-binding CsgD family transcriptional regulator